MPFYLDKNFWLQIVGIAVAVAAAIVPELNDDIDILGVIAVAIIVGAFANQSVGAIWESVRLLPETNRLADRTIERVRQYAIKTGDERLLMLANVADAAENELISPDDSGEQEILDMAG